MENDTGHSTNNIDANTTVYQSKISNLSSINMMVTACYSNSITRLGFAEIPGDVVTFSTYSSEQSVTPV